MMFVSRRAWLVTLAAVAVTASGVGGGQFLRAQPSSPPLPLVMQAEARMHLTEAAEPRYPLLAGASGVRGPVVFEIEVSREGHVTSARLLHGTPLLEQSALEAVTSWRFSPLSRDDQPTAYRTSMVVTFDDPAIDADTLAGLTLFGDALMLCLEASRAGTASRAERRCHLAGDVADRFTRIDRWLPTRARRLEAEALLGMDRPVDAIRLLEPMQARLRQIPFFSLDRSLGLVALARAYIRLDRADDAIRAYTQADRQLTDAHAGAPRDSPFRAEAAGHLRAMMPGYVQLLEVTGRRDEADRVRGRLADLR